MTINQTISQIKKETCKFNNEWDMIIRPICDVTCQNQSLYKKINFPIKLLDLWQMIIGDKSLV